MSDSEEGDDINQKYIALNTDGIKAYRKIQGDMFKGWCMWAFAGVQGGTGLAQGVRHLPMKVNSPRILNKYKAWTIAIVFSGLSYHGYKVQLKEFNRNRKQLLQNKSLCTLISKDEVAAMTSQIQDSKKEQI